MAFLIRILLIIYSIVLLIGCGSQKVLTNSEVEKLTSEQKKDYLLKMASQKPEYVENFISLANYYLDNNDTKKAFLSLKKGIKKHPSNAKINFIYGQLAVKQNKLKEGFGAFKVVLKSAEAYSYKDKIGGYVQEKYGVAQIIDSKYSDAYPVFSNDDESIYFQSNRNGNWDIYNFNIVNNQLTQITFSTANEELPWISADGKYLYYTSTEDDKRPVSYVSKSRNIYVKDLKNNSTHKLTNTLSNDWLPRSEWNGNRIAFVSERKDLRDVPLTEKRSLVYTMDRSGDFQIPLLENDNSYGNPVFSHSGNYLYFDVIKIKNYEIARYSFEKKQTITLVATPGSDNVGAYPSTTDSSIVYFSNRDGNYELYRLNISNNEEERLTTNPGNDLNPVFSNDGSKIIFFSDRFGKYDIFLLNFATQGKTMTLEEILTALDKALSNM